MRPQGPRPRKPIDEAREGLRRRPSDLGARLRLASLLIDEGLVDEAAIQLDEARGFLDHDFGEGEEQGQLCASWHDLMGDLLYRQGDFYAARVHWETASRLDEHGVGDAARRKLREHSAERQ
jgi:predicted negative regulator of RcsB-dependent stress response